MPNHDGTSRPEPNRPHWFDKWRCLQNFMSVFEGHDITLVADGVTDDVGDKLKNLYPWVDLRRTTFGSNAGSFLYCLEEAVTLDPHTNVYFVEDDYLHCTEAIQEMLFTYGYLKSYYHLQKDLCLFPFDNREDYEYTFIIPGRLFRTPTRHWKEGIWTTFTMMTKPKVFQDHWEIFEKLASQYTPWNGIDEIKELVHEGNTISNIWEHYVTRVNPVPSLALHIQFEKQRDPHIDHLKWWDKYSKIKSFGVTYD